MPIIIIVSAVITQKMFLFTTINCEGGSIISFLHKREKVKAVFEAGEI